ncbi:MAG: hypothetical protein JJ895_05100 [Balneolaceae bacterium]|nr:hypothetical protein [Balneolaceae bacterium]
MRVAKVLRILQICNKSDFFSLIQIRVLVFGFALLIGFSSQSEAQQFQFLSVDGTEFTFPDEIENQVRNKPDSGVEVLTTFLADQGFLSVKVSRQGNKFLIIPGMAFSMTLIISSGNTTIDSVTAIPYKKQKVEELIGDALDSFIEVGFYFAEAEITRFEVDTTVLLVEIQSEIVKGERVFISGLITEGNRLNSDAYINRISGLGDSLVANPASITQIQESLRRSELFETVTKPELRLVDEEAYLLVEVEERRLNQFDGVLGYVPDANGNGQVVGDVSLNLWSVFAEGNGIDFSYQRIEPEVSRLQAQIKQYWIGTLPIGLDAGIRFFQNDTTYQHREFSLGGFYRASSQLKLTSGLSFEGTTGSKANLIEPGGNRRTVSLGFDISTLDQFEVPTRGFRAVLSVGFSDKSIEIDSLNNSSQQHLRSYLAGFTSLSDQSVLAARLHSFFLNGDGITDSDLFRFGGAKSLRGFAEEQFAASTMVWGDLEYRFLTNRDSYLFTFVAVGRYHRPKLVTEQTNQFVQTDWLHAFGFGLNYRVRVGRLSFSYAISPISGFGNGKVHVALSTRL